MTEQNPSAQVVHANQFGLAARNMQAFADQILRDRPPGFDPLDIASLFLGTATKCLVAVLGTLGAADYLRRLADGLETGKPTQN